MLEEQSQRANSLNHIATLYDELPRHYRVRLMIAFLTIGFSHRLYHCLKTFNLFQ